MAVRDAIFELFRTYKTTFGSHRLIQVKSLWSSRDKFLGQYSCEQIKDELRKLEAEEIIETEPKNMDFEGGIIKLTDKGFSMVFGS